MHKLSNQVKVQVLLHYEYHFIFFNEFYVLSTYLKIIGKSAKVYSTKKIEYLSRFVWQTFKGKKMAKKTDSNE